MAGQGKHFGGKPVMWRLHGRDRRAGTTRAKGRLSGKD